MEIPDRDQPREIPERYVAPSSWNREDNDSIYRRAVEETNRRDAEWMAKLGVIAVGTHLMGRAVNRNIFAELADYAGAGARFLGGLRKNGPQSNIRPELADGLYRGLGVARDSGGAVLQASKGGARLDSFDSIQDLASALGFMWDPRNATNRKGLEGLFKRNFDKLYRSGPNAKTPSFFQHDLTPLTFGELMSRQQEWISHTTQGFAASKSLEVNIVKKALDMNLIKPNQIVDANLFMSSSGKLIDARIIRPSKLLTDVAEVFNPFGLVSSIKSFVGSNRTVGDLGIDKTTRMRRVFVGGTIHELRAPGHIAEIDTAKTLGEIGDNRFIPAILRENPPVTQPTVNPTFFESVQDAIGVGPKFHEKRGGFIQGAVQFFKNLRGVATGEAEIYARDYRYMQDSLYNRVTDAIIPEGATASGQEFAKGKFYGRRVLQPDDLTPKTGIFKDVRGFFQRLKTYAGIDPDTVLLKKGASKNQQINKEDLYSDFGRAGLDSLETTLGERSAKQAPTSVTVTGKKDFTVRPQYYAASDNAVDKLYDLANWMTIRLNKLSSASLLGFGFKPSGNVLANAARVAAIPSLYMAGFEAIKYTDYQAGELFGTRPSEAVADLYTQARVAQQETREALGITNAIDYVEKDLLPGFSVGAVGTVGSLVAAVKGLEKSPTVIGGLAKAVGLYALFGGPDPNQSADSLRREYSGEEKIPVRKSRWWTLGYQPFSGGDVDYYKPSWYVQLKQQPYDTNIYGSPEGYWKYGSMLPTPENWFGLRRVIDPYALEKQTYYDRPYPSTAKMFENVPVFGPILSDTIGEIIKPSKVMHPEQQSYVIAASNINQRGVPNDAARRLGIPDVPATVTNFDRPDVVKDRLDKWANVALEPAGVWKFALGMFGVKFDDDYNMAEASNMTSLSRAFYNMNLGGLFGETELLRRFLMSDYGLPSKINQQINPIRNTMPRWLPGMDSEYETDQTFFTDFTRGDAYTKIPGGEFRLPGAGYEAVNRLHSGVSGVYSDVDRYLILSDIAPFSSAFFDYQRRVQQMNLSPYWQYKVQQAEERRVEKQQIYNFASYGSSQDMAARANESGLTKGVREGWLNVTQGFLAEKPLIGSKLFPFTDPYRIYLKERVEGDTYADWTRPVETIVRPTFYDVIGQNPITATTKALSIGALISSPMASFLNPFPAIKDNPAATTLVAGLIGFGGSITRMGVTGTMSHGFVPDHVQKERETEEYLDKLRYAKFRALEAKAEERGDSELAYSFAKQAKATTTYGLAQFRATGDDTRYRASLGKADRPFYEEFRNAPPEKQEKILRVVPDHMKEVLSATWTRTQTGSMEPTQTVADREAVDYFSSHALPGSNWAGWHPAVPDLAIKVRAIQAGINGVSDNLHRFGVYGGQSKEADLRFPFLDAPATNIHDTDETNMQLMMDSLLQNNDNPFRRVSSFRNRLGSGPGVDWYLAHVTDHRKNDVLAFYQDVYR